MNKYDYTAKDLCKSEESTSDKVIATVAFIAFIIIVALGV
jgi:hypothetical protein